MIGFSQKQTHADSLPPGETVKQQASENGVRKLKIEELEARLAPAGKSDLVDG
jgi:hypothetical protein